MPHSARLYLQDMQRAARNILMLLEQVSLEAYRREDMRRWAVERQFTVLGEALALLSKAADESLAEQFVDKRRIIGFRNRLMHGYSGIDDAVVYATAKDKLPDLLVTLEALLDD